MIRAAEDSTDHQTGPYSISGTSIESMLERWVQHDNLKDAANHDESEAADAAGHHLRRLLEEGVTVHLRVLFLVDSDRSSNARVVSAEGHLTD